VLAPRTSISFVVGYKRFKFVDKKGEIYAKKGENFAKKRRNFRKKGEIFAKQDFWVFLQSKSKMQGLEAPPL